MFLVLIDVSIDLYGSVFDLNYLFIVVLTAFVEVYLSIINILRPSLEPHSPVEK